MAGDWMKVEHATPDKPEVFQIAQIIGADPDAVFAKCFRVWSWFDIHTENGNAPVTVAALLNRLAGCDNFVEAMEKVGWIVVKDDQISLPNFDRHTGETAKKRGLNAKRQAAFRERNAGGVTDGVTREEKRREEKEKKDMSDSDESGTRCPWREIVKAYHEELPAMPNVSVARFPGSKSQINLRARWRERPEHQNLDFWRAFFGVVGTNPWWVEGTDESGQKKWKGANFHWLVERRNFDKVIELWENGQ